MVTHDAAMARAADRRLVMRDGLIVDAAEQSGPAGIASEASDHVA